ncbi:MAG: hemolysin III family protein [Spirochaetales bacterium]|nr:MAG: hemolysin III family protein [Spirochaetales bacterium]
MTQPSPDRELSPGEIQYTSGGAIEEILNGVTHAIGAGMAIAGLAVLLVLTGNNPDPWKYVSFSVYGVSQILLYLSSALLHSFASFPRIRERLSRIDHASIYLLIAGTYTPPALTILRGPWGWTVLGVVWGLAIVGIVMKLFVMKKLPLIVDLLYIPLGWMVLIVIRPLSRVAPPGFLTLMLSAGFAYSFGFVFYAWRKLRYSHVVWHLFVLAGSTLFFLAFAIYLV